MWTLSGFRVCLRKKSNTDARQPAFGVLGCAPQENVAAFSLLYSNEVQRRRACTRAISKTAGRRVPFLRPMAWHARLPKATGRYAFPPKMSSQQARPAFALSPTRMLSSAISSAFARRSSKRIRPNSAAGACTLRSGGMALIRKAHLFQVVCRQAKKRRQAVFLSMAGSRAAGKASLQAYCLRGCRVSSLSLLLLLWWSRR